MYLKKSQDINFVIHILSLVIFVIISVGSNLLYLTDTKKITDVSANLKGECGCSMINCNCDTCSCKQQLLENNSTRLTNKESENILLNAFISNSKCSYNPDNLHVITLSYYEYLYADTSVCFPKRVYYLSILNEQIVTEMHPSRIFRPPKKIT